MVRNRARIGWAALVAGALGWAGVAPPARADEFERLDGRTIRRLTTDGGGAGVAPSLTFNAIAAMPTRLADSRSALVLARTGQGHLVRLLLLAELRRPTPAGDASGMAPAMTPSPAMKAQAQVQGKDKAGGVDPNLEPVPVIVVERLDTFDASDPAQRLTTRREVVLFDGLPIDLDSGQVVPPDPRFGADLVFRATPGGPTRLEPVGGARLFTLTQPFAPGDEAGAVPRPSPGRAVLPGDFAGRYRLFSNGQWSGGLDLKVGERGAVTGQFRSDLHGATYPVTGQVAGDAPGRLRFAVALPRARQEFDGYLFGEGKGAMAGTASLLERTFGFFAVRDGGRFAPEGADLGPLGDKDVERPGRVTLERRLDGSMVLDGQVIPPDGLAAALQTRAEGIKPDAPPAWLVVQGPAATRLADLEPIVRAAHDAGINSVRFAATSPPRE